MPRTASANSHMISGFSGLPKLRQLVSASGPRAGARDVARRLGHGRDGSLVGIEGAPARIAVHGERDRLVGGRAVLALDAHQGRVSPGAEDGVALDELVVLSSRSSPWNRSWASRAAPGAHRPGLLRAPPPPGRASGARAGIGGLGGGSVELRRVCAQPGRPGCPRRSSPYQRTCMRPSSVTRPTTTASRSQRAKISQHLVFAAGCAPPAAFAPGSRTGATRRASCSPRAAGPARGPSRSRCPQLLAISKDEQVSPAAPMSWMPTIASVCISSRQASIRHFSVNGSPTCTVGRFDVGGLRRTRPKPAGWRRGCRRARSCSPRRSPGCRIPSRGP